MTDRLSLPSLHLQDLREPQTDRYSMNELDRLHQEAMELVDRAILCRRQGKPEAAIELLNAAFIQEKAAADLSALDLALEPSRSVLHRSAASLAIECHEFRSAEKLIGRALSGNPPADIAEELRDLLIHEVYPQRQLLA